MRKKKCPKCKSENLRPISYGMGVPVEWINNFPIDAAGAVMGGCVVDLDDPSLICLDCGKSIA